MIDSYVSVLVHRDTLLLGDGDFVDFGDDASIKSFIING